MAENKIKTTKKPISKKAVKQVKTESKKKKKVNKTSSLNTRPLNEREKIFCREYVKQGNGQQSAIKAGYSPRTAIVQASRLLTRDNIKQEITRLSEKREQKAIMDANEVMDWFSKIARGEVKDQFGLDASLNDRLKAMQEIAKRTIDIENRIKGVGDNNLTVKIDWKRD